MSQTEVSNQERAATTGNGGNGAGHSADSTNASTLNEHSAPPQASAPPDQTESPANGKSSLRRILLFVLVVAGVVLGGGWGYRAWRFGQTHVSTDDAFVTGNLINVSPTINGRLAELLVDEGDLVKKGQLVARLTNNTQQAAVQQAEAALHAAQSQIPQAESGLAFTEMTTSAAIQRAQAAVAAQQARTLGAQRQVGLTSATVSNQVAQARSQVVAARAQAEQSDAQVASARTAVAGARLGAETAERASRAVNARIDAARAEAERAGKDEERYRLLLDQQAVSQQQFDAIHAAAIAAQSRLVSAQEEASQSRSQVDQAREAIIQAEAQLRAAQKANAAARQQVSVAQTGVSLAKSRSGQVGVQQAEVQAGVELGSQAAADVASATAGREQISLRQKQVETAKAQAAQAAANLRTAKIAESHTYIFAPADGVVVKKEANPGAALMAGQSIVTITQGEHVWVTANFKETQLKGVRSGQPADVEIDTFPGRIYHARVQSINETTGAATALLPPDNATGNFTKVVQRVPVRVELLPARPGEPSRYATSRDIQALRQGMSAAVVIDTAKSER